MNPAPADSPQRPLLIDLPANTVARVVEVADNAIGNRLRAMGVCVGRTVELIRPGNPLIVSVLGTRVGLAEQVAGGVIVEPIDVPGSGLDSQSAA